MRQKMPTRASRNNPRRVGDIVHLHIKWTGHGEGQLWRVTKVDGDWVSIEPILTITGSSKLKKKRVAYHTTVVPSLDSLCSVHEKLNALLFELAVQLGRQDAC